MKLRRAPLAVVWAALVLAQPVSMAAAQGNLCLELEARLIAIDQSANAPRGTADIRGYDASVAQQRNEIDRASAEARRAGCTGGFLIFQRRAEAKCPQLMEIIDRMRANLQHLMRNRGQADPFNVARERNDILRTLAQNGCGPNYAAAGDPGGFPAPQQPRGLFATLFGEPQIRTFGDDAYFNSGGFGTFRTLCVRTCDGYYFPISFSTVPAKFGDDAMSCQQMCPGAEAVLYTHRNPGEDAAAMVSLAGEPYASLPTAYRYRKEYDKACTCGPAMAALGAEGTAIDFSPMGSLDPFGDAEIAFEPAAVTFAVPLPRLRPAAGEDPETAANRRGAFSPRPIVAKEGPDLAGVSADGRKIRVVGPEYFYAQ